MGRKVSYNTCIRHLVGHLSMGEKPSACDAVIICGVLFEAPACLLSPTQLAELSNGGQSRPPGNLQMSEVQEYLN